MHMVAERNGSIMREDSRQDRMIGGLYGHVAGRILLRLLITPAVSKLAGKFLDTGISRVFIQPFIRSNKIRMEDYEKKDFDSFNDFFKRKLLPGARRVDREAENFISPCDSRLSVYKIEDNSVFSVKHTSYTVKSLLRSRKLAEHFAGGYVWVFRLCVDDYHRYVFVDDGINSRNVCISGVFHTVNPIANDSFPIYKDNTREYSLLKSKNFGIILQMEVGAMLVGKIENHTGKKQVKRGEEKGNFAYGGSTVILMTRRGTVIPDEDILKNSAAGMETRVRLGERVGAAAHSPTV